MFVDIIGIVSGSRGIIFLRSIPIVVNEREKVVIIYSTFFSNVATKIVLN